MREGPSRRTLTHLKAVRWRRHAWGAVAAALAVHAVAFVGILLAKGGSPPRTGGDGEPVGQLHHVHGMAVDPKDPRVLYVATHGGLIRLTDSKQWSYVGEDRSDYMGFTMHPEVKGVIFVSGHPDLQSNRPNPMGVLMSRDGGRTWKTVALEGAADMHAMTFSRPEAALYGWNVAGKAPGLYRVNVERGKSQRLEARGLQQVLALAAHPREKGRLLAGTTQGLMASAGGGTAWEAVPGALAGVPVTALAYHPGDARRVYAYGFKASLGFVRSADGGKTWKATGFLLPDRDGVVVIAPSPHAPDTVFIATAGGDILRSEDAGATWTPLAKAGRPTVK
jgi:photosystem II stability/assembly factor-like uncharacterized protein